MGERVSVSRRVILSVALLVGLAAIVAAAPVQQTLIVEDVESGESLLVVPAEDGMSFELAYEHSVERTPVLEAYAIRGERIEMTRMEFESYGWGLPSREEVTVVNGTFVATPDWSGDEFVVQPGHIAGHRLTVDGRTYDLVALSNGTAVRIHVGHRSALAVFLHDGSHDNWTRSA